MAWIRVEKISQKDDLVLVRLPEYTFQNGPHVTVKIRQGEGKPKDEGIALGLQALGRHMTDPNDTRALAASKGLGPKGKLNLYFLWSVERVGVLYNLKTIGGKDWYRWGVDLLLPAQNRDGSWTGRGNGGTAPVIDTSMALLFLKRSDLLPDLRETLQKRQSPTPARVRAKRPIPRATGRKRRANPKARSTTRFFRRRLPHCFLPIDRRSQHFRT